MADKKISELDAVGSVAVTDQVVLLQSGTTKRGTITNLGDVVSLLGSSQTHTGVPTFTPTADNEDRAWLEHDPSLLDASTAKFLFTVADRDINAGTREDVVYRWGYNPAADVASDVADAATDPFSFADVLETHFEPTTGGEGQFERYWSFSDDSSEYRPLMSVVPKETVGSARFKSDMVFQMRSWHFEILPTLGSSKRIDVNFENTPYTFHIKDGNLKLETQDGSVPDNGGSEPSIILRGKYDSDTSAGITASSKVFTIKNSVAHNGGAGSHTLKFVSDAGATVIAADGDNSRVAINRGAASDTLDVGGGLIVRGQLQIGTTIGAFNFHQAGGSYAHLGAPASGPTTSSMGNGSVIFWLDETNNELEIQAKYSDGTLKTASIALA